MDTLLLQPSLFADEPSSAPALPVAPVYHRWAKVPDGLATRTALRRARLQLPETAAPAALFESAYGRYLLYHRDQAVPMPPPARGYPAFFSKRYPDRRVAYLPACEALFSLNHHAKHPDCDYAERRAIYDLKDRWTQRLWEEGFCVGALLVYSPHRDLKCWYCDGTGDDGWDDGNWCSHCDGEGVYRTIDPKPYWALRYQIDGKQFFWHQPAWDAPWARPVGTEEDHKVTFDKDKALLMAPEKIREARALLSWILNADKEEPPHAQSS